MDANAASLVFLAASLASVDFSHAFRDDSMYCVIGPFYRLSFLCFACAAPSASCCGGRTREMNNAELPTARQAPSSKRTLQIPGCPNAIMHTASATLPAKQHVTATTGTATSGTLRRFRNRC